MAEVPMLPETRAQLSDEAVDSNFQRVISRTQSDSISISMVSLDPQERETNLVEHNGPLCIMRKTPFVQTSGPYATPGTGNLLHHIIDVTGNEVVESKADENPKVLTIFDPKFHNSLYGDAKGFGRKLLSFCSACVPGVMNPDSKIVQQWHQFLAIFCLVAIFVDPLFFFLIYVKEDDKCIVINWTMTTTLVILRSITDFLCFLNIVLQFRLAFVVPGSRVFGIGELVDHPKRIAFFYLRGYFLLDLFAALPLPQIMILFVLPNSFGASGASYALYLLCVLVLVQHLPILCRFLPTQIGQSLTGFVFASIWANFIINLLIFMLSGHVVGSCWYLLGLQRVNQCLRDACHHANLPGCMELIGCGPKVGNISALWSNNTGAVACLNPTSDAFSYGIYANAVPLTTETKVVNKYVFALFWGFQQISTLAGNQTPSNFVGEVLFTMVIIGLGLLLLALLIGNIQNFVQGLGRRRLEMHLRGREVEQWMSHRRIPEDLRRRARQAEQYNWAATTGVNGEMLMENWPEDLQKDMRRHLFKFVKKVRIFSLMDEPILDAIHERLKHKTYIRGSRILSQGDPVEKMVFVLRGKLESVEEDGIRVPLSEGDACGEELLTWYFEHSSESKDGNNVRLPGQRLVSNRTVRCLTNVEAFSLCAADLEEVTILFSGFLRRPDVQAALRYKSPYWRSLAANRIQVAWRYRKKCLSRANTSQTDLTLKS